MISLFSPQSKLEPRDDVIRPLLANEAFIPQKLRNGVSYLLFGAFLQSDPVLPIRADVHFVGLDKVNPPGLLGNGALGADGRDEPQEPEIHLWRVKRETTTEKKGH